MLEYTKRSVSRILYTAYYKMPCTASRMPKSSSQGCCEYPNIPRGLRR